MMQAPSALVVSLLLAARVVAQTDAKSVAELAIPAPSEGARRPITVQDLVVLREIGGMAGSGLSLSPDGRYVAFELHQALPDTNTYRVAWFVAPTNAAGSAVNVGDGGDPLLFRPMDDDGSTNGAWISEAPVWSQDGQWILYRRKANGDVQIWRSDRSGGIQQQLTHNAADVQSFVWSPSGTKLYFEVDAPRTVKLDARRAQAERGYYFDLGAPWSTLHGKPLEARYSLTGGKPEVWVYEGATGIERRATQQERAEHERGADARDIGTSDLMPAARVVARAQDGQSVAWLAPAHSDKQGIQPPLSLYASRSADGRNSIRCSDDRCTGMIDESDTLGGGIWWNDNGSEIYYVRREGANYGRRVLYAWRVEKGDVRQIHSTAEWISDCRRVAARAICFRESPTYPRTVVSIDLHDGSVRTLVDPNPEFRLLALSDVERLEWKDKQGNATFGYLIRPVNYKPGIRYPLIIVGYRAKRTVRGGTGDEYPVHVFAANGFAVLSYDTPEPWDVRARFSDPKEALFATWGEELTELSTAQSLLESAIDLLEARGIIDASRIGISGFSTGASQVGYALIHSDRFAAAAMSSVPWSPFGYYLSSGGASWRAVLRQMGLGPLGGSNDHAWKKLSLALNVDRLEVPVLVNATDFEYLPAMQDLVAFTEANKPMELYVYPDEFHVKWHPKHRLHVYERNLDWFNFWLRDVEDPDPAKADQYERWRKLRTLRRSHETVRSVASQP